MFLFHSMFDIEIHVFTCTCIVYVKVDFNQCLFSSFQMSIYTFLHFDHQIAVPAPSLDTAIQYQLSITVFF